MSSKLENAFFFVVQILSSLLAYSLTHCWSAFMPLELLIMAIIGIVYYYFKRLITEYTTWLSDPAARADVATDDK
jgi:hypothetical protein